MPTGVALRDVREQLFDAAERVLLRDGPSALTSRAVTTEAGCAKGVLHRHFADFDAFLAEFVLDRVDRIHPKAAALSESAGTGTVVGNLTDALTALFSSVAVAIVPLITFRDGLRARLRRAWPAGVPVLTEAATMIAAYLSAERDLGRIATDADVDMLGPMLIGAGHLLFADRNATPPEAGAVRKMVTTVLGGTLPRQLDLEDRPERRSTSRSSRSTTGAGTVSASTARSRAASPASNGLDRRPSGLHPLRGEDPVPDVVGRHRVVVDPRHGLDGVLSVVHSPSGGGVGIELRRGRLGFPVGWDGGLVGAGAGDVEEDAGPEHEQQHRPDPVQAQRLVGPADQEQQAEHGEGEAEGERDGVELVAAHQGASARTVVVGTVGGAAGRSPRRSSNGPTSWKERGSLARRTSITP